MAKSKEVEDWFATYDNPMKDVVMRIRDIVLRTDPRIGECIKGQAPTFTFDGNIASFSPKSKEHASLMFHEGARIPGKHPRLEGTGDASRTLKLASLQEVNDAKGDISRIINAWCAWRTSERATERAEAEAAKYAELAQTRALAAAKPKPVEAKAKTAAGAKPKAKSAKKK